MPGKLMIEEDVNRCHVLGLAKPLKEAHCIHGEVLLGIEVGIALVVHLRCRCGLVLWIR
ncbi:MAG: hypothetical protein Q7T82_11200 [Armatimonadota bacterium]|nr:hypothetical protein [Armatimonadota bacterium]